MSPVKLRVKWFLFLVLLVWLAVPGSARATVVRLQTSLGVADIELFDTQAPLTVANFLNYVNRGAYNNSIIHRSVPNFVVQGGGYGVNGNSLYAIVKDPPVANEFSADRSNLRGTVAMAKIGGNPDSATTEWFVNLKNNAANLDYQNGGFTVFGRVLGNGMAVFDAIAALPTYDLRSQLGSAFANLPVTGPPPARRDTLVVISSVMVLPTTTAATPSDRLFNYLEAAYPQFLAPASQPSATAYGYYFRYYPDTSAFIATRDDGVYYLGPLNGENVLPLGALADWLALAVGSGY